MRSYVLDASDRIIAIEGEWQRFWQENGGQGDVAGQVVGQVLWDSIKGTAAIDYLSNIFENARRTGLRASQQYRCDSGALERVFVMLVEPLGGGHLRVNHNAVRSRPHALGLVRDIPQTTYRQCSQCLSCNYGGMWVSHLRVRFAEGSVAVDAVCPTCVAGCNAAEMRRVDDNVPLAG